MRCKLFLPKSYCHEYGKRGGIYNVPDRGDAMKILPSLCVLVCLGIGNALAASTSSSSTTNSNTPPDKAALEAALTACASSAGKDSNGQPDMQAMDTCMTAKGFTKPGGPPPGQGSGGQGNLPPPKK
jgi:hypothetical protein